MLKVADSVALQFQSFQRLVNTSLKGINDTPASSTDKNPKNLIIRLLGFFVSVYPAFFQMCSYLNELGTSIFIAIEPIGANIDIIKNTTSQLYGVECSFSYDYVKLFKNVVFSLWYKSKVPGKMHEDYFGVFSAINT